MHTNQDRLSISLTVRSFAAGLFALVGVAALTGVGACTDVGEGDATGGSGGSGGAASATTSGTTSTSSTTASSSSTGGAGGCLPAGSTDAVFTIATNDLCAVARYDAPDLTLDPFGAVPTWGRHQGPLTSSLVTGATDEIHLQRWNISGTTLAKTESVVAGVTQIPAMSFFGAQAVDLPFGSLTAVSWSGQDFMHQGGFLFLDATSVVGTHLATGVYGTAALGTAQSARLVYTGLSAVDGPTNGTTALYAADFANGTLGTSQAIATWGEADGPVAVDTAGNVLAIDTKFSDSTQELRVFPAASIASGSPPTAGTTLLVTDGYGNALAAVAPTAQKPGLALFQPQLGANGTHGDVLVVRWQTSGSTPVEAGHEALLTLTTPDTLLTLMTDDQGRVWVGAPAQQGSTFYVLARP
jgi:hypothetical protein